MGEVIDFKIATEQVRARKRVQSYIDDCAFLFREVELGICTLSTCYIRTLPFNVVGLEATTQRLVRKMGEHFATLEGVSAEGEIASFNLAQTLAISLRQNIWDLQFINADNPNRLDAVHKVEKLCEELRSCLQPYFMPSALTAHV